MKLYEIALSLMEPDSWEDVCESQTYVLIGEESSLGRSWEENEGLASLWSCDSDEMRGSRRRGSSVDQLLDRQLSDARSE